MYDQKSIDTILLPSLELEPELELKMQSCIRNECLRIVNYLSLFRLIGRVSERRATSEKPAFLNAEASPV